MPIPSASNRSESGSEPVFDPKYFNSLSALYSNAFLASVADGRHVERLTNLIRNSRALLDPHTSLYQFFDRLYDDLMIHYRCEYVYKNEIANQLLLSRHSVEEAAMFTEFSAAGSKADVVIVNGHCTAYEIKTELDSLVRLKSQIASYKKVFQSIYVVTNPEFVEKVLSEFDDEIGLIELSPEGVLTERREASQTTKHLNHKAIFDCLRISEITAFLEASGVHLVDVPNTRRYSERLSAFSELSIDSVSKALTIILRNRSKARLFPELIAESPHSLKALYLAGGMDFASIGILHRRLYSRLT